MTSADVVADDGQCTLREAVIAANTGLSSVGVSNPDVFNSAGAAYSIYDYDDNRIGNDSGSAGAFTAGHDLAGASAHPINSLLGGLTGSPAVRPLLPDSPAINRAPAADCTYHSDGINALYDLGDR